MRQLKSIIKLFLLLGLISLNFEIIILTGAVILLARLRFLSGIRLELSQIHDNLVWSLVVLRA